MKKVQDIMTKDVKVCKPDTNLAAAAALMWENDCGVLPVVDDEGKVLAIITDRDICIALATRSRLASDVTVNEVISGEVYSCALDDDVTAALKTMQRAKVHRLPVVTKDDGKLQGILSLNDIVLHAEEARGRQIPGVSFEDVARTLKTICEHRTPEVIKHTTV